MLLREAWYVVLSLARQYGRQSALERHRLRQLNGCCALRERVPYYRDGPGYGVGLLGGLADLAAFPVLTKADLRGRPPGDFLADGTVPERCVEFHTSGTTGQRLRVLHDRDNFDYHTAAGVRRFLATGGYLPTYRLSHLRHFTTPRRAFERLGLFRRHVILTHRPMAQIKGALLANRPQVIIGYPVHLRELLRNLGTEELARLRRTLRLLMTESELLVPEHRRALAEGFGVPLFDEYSAYEVLNVYFECRHGRCHLAEDRVHVEIVDAAGDPLPDGREGRVVVTAFMERAMPLVRYGLGDAGVIEPDRCPAGGASGHAAHQGPPQRPRGAARRRGAVLRHLPRAGRDPPGVAECFVHQDRDGLVRFYAVPTTTTRGHRAVLASIRDTLFELAGGPFPLEVTAADRVPITAGGKGRFVTSEYHQVRA